MDEIKNHWEEAGVISVDAGLCWVGDPCYIIHTDKVPKEFGRDWSETCDALDKKGLNNKDALAVQFNHDMGHSGLGVAVSTGWGDGQYPVFVRRDPQTGRCAAVMVEFIPRN